MGDSITIPYAPGEQPYQPQQAQNFTPPETTSPDVSAQLPVPSGQQESFKLPQVDLPPESWGHKVYHGILNALGGKYSQQFIPTPNGVVQNTVENTPGQQWKNIIAGALTGAAAGSAAGQGGPGGAMRAMGAGTQAGYQQRVKLDEDQRESAMKMATSNAQVSLMAHQIAESEWRLANSQREASQTALERLNSFNTLIANGGPGSQDLGTMNWQDAKKVAQEWPQFHDQQAQGNIVTVADTDENGVPTGKVRVGVVNKNWKDRLYTQDLVLPTGELNKDGTPIKYTVPGGTYTNDDITKMIMSSGAAEGQRQLAQARENEAARHNRAEESELPSKIANNLADAALRRAQAAAAQAKADGGDVEWGPGGDKGFNSWHAKTVTPALANERIYRLSSNVYNEYQALRAQGKDFPSGAQSVQMLSNHIAGTFGNVKGSRITKDMIEKHLHARGISDTFATAINSIRDGDQLSPAQWDAFFDMIGQNRKETWRSVLDDAQALGRPLDYIAFPQDLRQQWGLGPGHVPAATGLLPNEAPAAASQTTAAPGSAAAPPASALKEGVHTTFGNGQTWTLKNGQPVQVSAGGK
jgi:hypothetical protein